MMTMMNNKNHHNGDFFIGKNQLTWNIKILLKEWNIKIFVLKQIAQQKNNLQPLYLNWEVKIMANSFYFDIIFELLKI